MVSSSFATFRFKMKSNRQGVSKRVGTLSLTLIVLALCFLLVYFYVPSTTIGVSENILGRPEMQPIQKNSSDSVLQTHHLVGTDETTFHGEKLSNLLLSTRPLMRDPYVSFHPHVPRLVYEENSAWHSNAIPSWTTLHVIASRHIPEKNWLTVFTQGFNTKLYRLGRIPEPPQLGRMLCIIGEHSYRLASFDGPVNQDVVLCDLSTGPSEGPKMSDTVTVLLENKTMLPSVARFVPQTPRAPGAPIYNMCIFTQIKDQARYVRDWVDYHRRIGADHFYVSDNNSTDQLETIFRHDPDVEVLYWPFKKSQVQAYIFGRLAIESRCKWGIFMDLDQYIFINETSLGEKTIGGMVNRVLETDTKVNQICLHSKVYGSSGHGRIPNAQIPEAYIHTNLTGHNNEIWQPMPNCITRLSAAGLDTGIHRFNIPTPGGNQRDITMGKEYASFNHYSVRSFEDFIQKFEGRNGLVADWDPKSTPMFPKGPINLDDPPEEFANGLHGANEDTAFRDVYRKIVADRSVPLPPTYVPYHPNVKR